MEFVALDDGHAHPFLRGSSCAPALHDWRSLFGCGRHRCRTGRNSQRIAGMGGGDALDHVLCALMLVPGNRPGQGHEARVLVGICAFGLELPFLRVCPLAGRQRRTVPVCTKRVRVASRGPSPGPAGWRGDGSSRPHGRERRLAKRSRSTHRRERHGRRIRTPGLHSALPRHQIFNASASPSRHCSGRSSGGGWPAISHPGAKKSTVRDGIRQRKRLQTGNQ